MPQNPSWVDTARPSFQSSLDIFEPREFTHTCHVIGTGATGSRVAEGIARQGVSRIQLYDPDHVKAHNVPTGTFYPVDIGQPKVEVLSQRLAQFTGQEVICQQAAINTYLPLPGIVFVCVDTMDARRAIWQTCIRQQPQVKLMVEIRIGPQEGRIYTVNPCHPTHIRLWEEVSNYPSGHADSLPCTNRMIISTVEMAAALAVNQLVIWQAAQAELLNSILFCLGSQPRIIGDRWTI